LQQLVCHSDMMESNERKKKREYKDGGVKGWDEYSVLITVTTVNLLEKASLLSRQRHASTHVG